MLRELRIKNLAIIDDLRVTFESGFNVLTGETGAGKSIIVDALSVVLGSKVQPDFIRSGEKEAVVQAYVDVEAISDIPDLGIDFSEGLILRRSLYATGRSRAYINDTMVSQQVLSEVGRSLVDIHGQHEHQSLFSNEKQRLFIDAFGKLHKDRERVASSFRELQERLQEEAELSRQVQERAKRIDFLTFQIQEIDAASLTPGEKESLERERTILANLYRLRELAESAYSMIYGSDDSCEEKLSSILSKIREMSSLDQGASEVLTMLESVYPVVQDAAISLRAYRDKYDTDPVKLNTVEERLDVIRKLERKYGEGIASIIAYGNEARQELEGLEKIDTMLETVKEQARGLEETLSRTAAALSEGRRKTASVIEKLVMKELTHLGLNNAQFAIDLARSDISSHGIDHVEFLFSANPGEPVKPLAKIASGGELSRIMLALKTILADFDKVPVLIFDEVDAGIGGRTAHEVGRKLNAVSKKHQVLCATHLPQIASLADSHLKIEKIQGKERVHVEVRVLSGDERLHEIARMLSGKVTEVSLTHARELLGAVA
jgi:DNA repair protein RecN (Recombination protein N)